MSRQLHKRGNNQLRIIGGQWRSRKLAFPDVPGLRPTPDRVRETLFNWLAPVIAGAHVLDAYSGSGALLFEALSRGASSAVALERDSAACRSLQQNLTTLAAENARIVQTNSLDFLGQPASQRFDLVFVDPPFHQDMLVQSCQLLEKNGWLNSDAWIYSESELPPSNLQMPANWRLHREKHAGLVYYALWQRN